MITAGDFGGHRKMCSGIGSSRGSCGYLMPAGYMIRVSGSGHRQRSLRLGYQMVS